MRRIVPNVLCCVALLMGCLAGCARAITPGVASRNRCTTQAAIEPVEFGVATFNIHDGRGRDERFDLDRIAAVLPETDFVGLQEASLGNLRTGFADEPKELAGKWGHTAYGLFAWDERPIWDGGGLFGNGYSTSLRVIHVDDSTLPEIEGKGQRGVGWVEARVGDRDVVFFVTHIALPKDPAGDAHWPQVEAVVKKIDEVCGRNQPCVLVGDFNAYPAGPVVQRLLSRFDEVLLDRDDAAAAPRRDYIFITRDIEVVDARLIENDASDHPAIWCRLRLE